MKKLALLFITTFLLSGCNLDDDGSNLVYENALVTGTNLPESFEKGKSYKVEVTYLLPSACHSAAGIEARRGSMTGTKRRDIYVRGIAMKNQNQTECTIENEDLERESSFTIFIDESETYTFYLWDGFDDNENSQFVVVEVPVIE